MNVMTRLFRFMVGLDQALDPVVFGGSENVTISAELAYRELMLNKGNKLRRLVDWASYLYNHRRMHCYRSLLRESYEFPDSEPIRAKLKSIGVI